MISFQSLKYKIINWFKRFRSEKLLGDLTIKPEEHWPHWPPFNTSNIHETISWENRSWICHACHAAVSINPADIPRIESNLKKAGDTLIVKCQCGADVYKETIEDIKNDGCYTWQDYEKDDPIK